jgi:hypothetical protein
MVHAGSVADRVDARMDDGKDAGQTGYGPRVSVMQNGHDAADFGDADYLASCSIRETRSITSTMIGGKPMSKNVVRRP